MKAKKKFVVICYDIQDDRKREKIARLLERHGQRSNYSVFECMLTDTQLIALQDKINKRLNKAFDRVVYYTICVNCFTRIVKHPEGYDYVRMVEIV
jgi:CRISPR-associated protein Cas2